MQLEHGRRAVAGSDHVPPMLDAQLSDVRVQGVGQQAERGALTVRDTTQAGRRTAG